MDADKAGNSSGPTSTHKQSRQSESVLGQGETPSEDLGPSSGYNSPSYPSSLLADSNLGKHYNSSVMEAVTLQMQRLYGNSATRRVLGGNRAPANPESHRTGRPQAQLSQRAPELVQAGPLAVQRLTSGGQVVVQREKRDKDAVKALVADNIPERANARDLAAYMRVLHDWLKAGILFWPDRETGALNKAVTEQDWNDNYKAIMAAAREKYFPQEGEGAAEAAPEAEQTGAPPPIPAFPGDLPPLDLLPPQFPPPPVPTAAAAAASSSSSSNTSHRFSSSGSQESGTPVDEEDEIPADPFAAGTGADKYSVSRIARQPSTEEEHERPDTSLPRENEAEADLSQRASEIVSKAFGTPSRVVKPARVVLLDNAEEMYSKQDNLWMARGKINPATGRRWQRGDAKALSPELKAFTDKVDGVVYMVKQDGKDNKANLHTAVHETLHRNSNLRFVDDAGSTLDEGMTELLTLKALRADSVDPAQNLYAKAREATLKLMEVVGEQTLTDAYFKGFSVLRAAYDGIYVVGAADVLGILLDSKMDTDALSPFLTRNPFTSSGVTQCVFLLHQLEKRGKVSNAKLLMSALLAKAPNRQEVLDTLKQDTELAAKLAQL